MLGQLSLFNVFGAPWFAAIYLLLFASLVGCVLPRTVRLALAARQPPPRAPRNLTRLPFSVSYPTALAPEAALESAAGPLSGQRFRLRTGAGWVSAEKGYLREAGNLLFHIALLGVLVSIGLGGLFGYKANRLLVEGTSFANTVTALDEFHPGRLVSPGDLQPFSMTLNSFRASYVTSGSSPASRPRSTRRSATRPLRRPGPRSYTLTRQPPAAGGRRAGLPDRPRLRARCSGSPTAPGTWCSPGRCRSSRSRPRASPRRARSRSRTRIPSSSASPACSCRPPWTSTASWQSAFPAPLRPMVSLVSYAGNLGMNSGPSQSVYTLDTAGMHRLPVAPRPLALGQSMKLPNGLGTLTYTGYRQWISLAITYDPGQLPALISGIAVLGGLLLSFLVRRRRVFVRATAGQAGGTVVEVGGLTRSDAAGGFEDEFAGLAAELRRQHQDGPGAPGPGDVPASTDPAHPDPAHPDSSVASQEAAPTDSSLASTEGE